MTFKRISLITLLIVAAVLLTIGLIQPQGEEPVEIGTGLRVVVIGVDGLDWFLLARYAEAGRLPTIGKLLMASVTGELHPELPTLPEVSWPALAAGIPVVPTGSPGRPVRRFGVVPRIADVVSESGGSVLVVGWSASWPAADRDYAIVAGFAPQASEHVNELAPAVFPDGPGHASRPQLAEEISEVAQAAANRADEMFSEIIDLKTADADGWEDHLAAARWSHLSDLTMLDIGARLIAAEEPDLAMIHLPGLDAVSHRFLAPAAPGFFSELPDEALRFGEILPRYYEFIDRAVTRILRLTDDETVVVLCSTYGISPSLDVTRISGAHEGGPPGVLIVKGPRISPLPDPIAVTSNDVAPTILAILGVEIPDDIDGRVVLEVLPGGRARDDPP